MIKPNWLNKQTIAWALYDFGNSAFATTILAVIFNVYFVQTVVPPEGVSLLSFTLSGTALWSLIVSLSMLIIFATAPLLGAIADFSGKKKTFLKFFWVMGCLACVGLFFVKPGNVKLGAVFFVIGNIGFASSNIFYNAFLPFLCERSLMGRVSGFGWAAGYIGGGLCLALNLLIIKSPDLFHLSSENFLPVRWCLVSVGVWWFVFGLPFFLWIREEKASHEPMTPSSPCLPLSPSPPLPVSPSPRLLVFIKTGWSRLLDTFKNIRQYANLTKFLVAYVVYNDGIETFILMASVVGAQLLGMTPDELIMCFLMIQAVAFAGALGFGWLADKIRHKPVIFITLIVYISVCLWAFTMTSHKEFWILGVFVGLVLGGSQAASRSLMGLLTPVEKSAEFFSFFGIVGKLTAVFGPLLFGIVSQLWNLRGAVLSLTIFFIMGGFLLIFVNEEFSKKNEYG